MAIITLNTRYAFPSALAFGQNATGGRGGAVIQVTNLNASGAGSLKAALEASGTRIVVFRVGGTIDLAGGRITINNPNVTIAGETAPGGGILIKGGTVVVAASNVIVRHIRVRGPESVEDCIRLYTGGSTIQDIIMDHISASWGSDGNLDISNSLNVTVQNSFFSKNIKSNLINANSKNISYIQNIFALVDQRALRGNFTFHGDLTYEMINNYLYGVSLPTGASQGLKTTTENNVCEASNSFVNGTNRLIGFVAPDAPNTIESSYFYISGNDLGDAYIYDIAPSAPSEYIKSTPLYRSTYTPLPTTGLKAKLLADTGAGALTSQGLDSHDTGIIANINAKTGTISESGTFPTIASGTPYTDSNGDGISDVWATTHGISSATEVKATYTINGKTIINDAGYTAREIFFAELAGDFERLEAVEEDVPVITLNGPSHINLNLGDTYTELGAIATNTENEVIITGTVNTDVAGTYYRYYNVSNESGPAAQVVRTINVIDPSQPVKTGVGIHKNLFWAI